MAKKITLYSLLTVFALIISYLEGIAFAFIPVPAFKLGLANTVSMFLISKKDYFGGISVNFVRIILSALLFGNFYSFIFSLTGGILSTVSVIILIRLKCFSFAGISTAAAVLHNIGQIVAALILLNTSGILNLLAIMIITGAITGFLSGLLLNLFYKKYSKIHYFKNL